MRCASLLRLPARCTSAGRAPPSTTGCWRAAPGAPSCCGSRIRTASARPPRTSSRSSTRCAGSSSTGTRGRSSSRSAPTATARRSRSCSKRPRLPLQRDRRRRQGVQGAARQRPRLPRRAGGDGAVRLRVPDEGETVVDDVIRGETRFAHVHMDDPVIARADGIASSTTSRSRSTTSTPASRTSCAARTTSRTRPSSCSCSRRSGRAAALRAPAAAARPRRQEALQAPRRRLRAGAARRRLPARGGAQLRRAARAGSTPSEETFSQRGAGAAAAARADLEAPAVFDEKKLRHFNGRYLRELPVERADRAARGVHRPRRAARRGRDQPREDPDAGRLLAARRLPLRRPGRRPGGVGEDDRREGGAEALAAAREALARAPSRSTRSGRGRAARAGRGARVQAEQVFQPLRVALAGTTISPGSSRASRCSARRDAAARRRRARARRSERPDAARWRDALNRSASAADRGADRGATAARSACRQRDTTIA